MFDQIEDSGGFFKPANHLTDLALIVEPKSVTKDVPNNYRGQVTLRDEVKANVTVFSNQAALDGLNPEERKGVTVAAKALSNALQEKMGGMLAVTVKKGTTKDGNTVYTFVNISDQAVLAKLGEYVTKRNAALEADMPEL